LHRRGNPCGPPGRDIRTALGDDLVQRRPSLVYMYTFLGLLVRRCGHRLTGSLLRTGLRLLDCQRAPCVQAEPVLLQRSHLPAGFAARGHVTFHQQTAFFTCSVRWIWWRERRNRNVNCAASVFLDGTVATTTIAMVPCSSIVSILSVQCRYGLVVSPAACSAAAGPTRARQTKHCVSATPTRRVSDPIFVARHYSFTRRGAPRPRAVYVARARRLIIPSG